MLFLVLVMGIIVPNQKISAQSKGRIAYSSGDAGDLEGKDFYHYFMVSFKFDYGKYGRAYGRGVAEAQITAYGAQNRSTFLHFTGLDIKCGNGAWVKMRDRRYNPNVLYKANLNAYGAGLYWATVDYVPVSIQNIRMMEKYGVREVWAVYDNGKRRYNITNSNSWALARDVCSDLFNQIPY